MSVLDQFRECVEKNKQLANLLLRLKVLIYNTNRQVQIDFL